MRNPFTNILKKLFTADYPYCIYCGGEYGVDERTLCCPACASKITGGGAAKVSGCKYTACYEFEGPVRRLVHRYKYDGERYLDEKIAQAMKNTCEERNITAQAIAYVPLHRIKKRKRGYDQSERIAKKLSALTGVPHIGALERTKNTVSQTHLTREQRMENVRGVFRVKRSVDGLEILLVDDVLTTGSTAAECARTLLENGAKTVEILVFAKAV
jgi:competence protein ComFC